MFNLFKSKTKASTELDYFKQIFQSNYEHFIKIHFPTLIYPELPSNPRFKRWQEQELYIIDKLIPESFKIDFEKEYSNFVGERFEAIKKNKNGNINLTKRGSLVRQFLDTQPKIFLNTTELGQTNYQVGDFNVFRQHLDNTPSGILKLTLESIYTEFPDSQLTWQRFTDESFKFELKKLLRILTDIDPLNHLDRIYDEDGNWELLQPEESSFLLIGTNSSNMTDRLKKRELEIEKIKN